MIGSLRCCNNIHWGDKDLCHYSMNVSWLHDIVPSKIKSNLNCRCQLTCDDWRIPNTKLKYCQCTSAALLCCKNTQLFNCIRQIITHDWWIWIVLFIPHCYKSSFSSGGCFCAFEILVALATKEKSGGSGIHREFVGTPETNSSVKLIKIQNCLEKKYIW